MTSFGGSSSQLRTRKMDLSGTLTTKKIAERRPPSSRTNKSRPATTAFSRRVNNDATAGGSLAQVGGLVPPLELHSSPVHLATRSLSARTTNSAATTSISGQHSTTSLPSKWTSSTAPSTKTSSGRKSKLRSRNGYGRDDKGNKLPPPSRRKNEHVSTESDTGGHVSNPLQGVKRIVPTSAKDCTATLAGKDSRSLDGGSRTTAASGGGFNFSEHLQKSVDPDRTDGSLSPEMDQFLQDIGSAVHSLSPQTRAEEDKKVPMSAEEEISHSKIHSSSHQKSRPKIAANFAAPTTANFKKAETAVKDSTSHSHSSIPGSTDIDPNVAASKIQQWYRDSKRLQATKVRSLLVDKRNELNRSRTEELQRIQEEIEEQERKERERQKRRAAKMQAARKVAIEELKRKREEKREKAEKIAQEEIALLEASGKIKRSKASQRKASSSKKKTDKANDSCDERSTTKVEDKVIEEFFEAGDGRQQKIASASTIPTTALDQHHPDHAHPPDHAHQSHSTYDNILKTLALLEEAPPPLATPTLDNSHSHLNRSGYYLSVDNVNRLDSLSAKETPGVTDPLFAGGAGTATSGGLSESKLQSILSYLDEMDKADQTLLSEITKTRARPKTEALPTPRTASVSLRTSSDKKRSLVKNGETTKGDESAALSSELDVATAVASDVTSTIMAQRLELDSKTKTVDMLQKALSQQRELTVYHAKEMEKEGQRRLDLQKQEYEGTIQRHQCFIDQLIDDKKVLSERCEQLVKELKELDKKCKTRLKTMEESHSAELAKIKQVSAAADKLRREKWRSDETQRIKEATVKSLEPEIQRIIAKGKAEIQKLKAVHEAELLQADERASRRFVAQMEEVRTQCAEEKEHACAHERELARQRYEKLAEQEELNYQQQRRRLFGEVQQEKEKLATQFHQQKVNLEQQQREMEEEKERFGEEMKVSHSSQLEELRRRHSSELRELRERMEVERQAWEENILKKQEGAMLTKEREMREQLRLERDKEIEMVISRLEEETASSREECERTAEARVKRIREKYEAELREVERSERQTLEKFNTMKSQLVEMEGEVARANSLLRQKEREVEQVSQVASKLTNERDNVADVVRQEFADRLVMTDEENKQLKIEMSELRARHKVELERMRKGKEREMEEVHERVKQALAKKEENLTSLRQQYEAALKRADHLEMLLERQRKELLKK